MASPHRIRHQNRKQNQEINGHAALWSIHTQTLRKKAESLDSALFCEHFCLEGESCREMNDSWFGGICNLSEKSTVDICARICKFSAIEEVEKLHTHLKIHSFAVERRGFRRCAIHLG